MGKKTVPYILSCVGIYLLLAAIELFLLGPLIDFIGTDFRTHLIVCLILLLLIDPLIVGLLSKRLPFARLKDGTEM